MANDKNYLWAETVTERKLQKHWKKQTWKPDQCKQRHSSVKVFTLCNKVQAPLTTYGGDYISWNGIIFSFNLWRSIVFLWGEFIAAGHKAFLDGAR